MPQSSTAVHLYSLLLGLLLGVLLTGGTLLTAGRPRPPGIALHPPPTPTATPRPTATPTAAPLTVFVSGAVARPGLYAVPAGARVGVAIEAAGGLIPEADPALVNQAQVLWDGAQIHVPLAAGPAQGLSPPAGLSGPPAGAAPGGADTSGGRIDVNTATQAELESLPGVGPSRAQAIIENRPYRTLEDLTRVPGIGAKTLESLKELIRLE